MKIGFINFGGGENTLGMEIIRQKLIESKYDATYIDIKNQRYFDDYDVLCFSIFWWEHKLNYIKFLKEAGINPLKRKPILVLGGLDMLYPIPLGNFYHYAVIGDGEDVIVPLIEHIQEEKELPQGVYVSGEKKNIEAQICKLEPQHYIDLRNAKQTRIEISRGCKNKCLFCLLSWIKPYQELGGEVLRHLIMSSITKNVALFCADRGSHSNYEDIELWCKKYGKRNTASDLRIDSAYKQKIISSLRFGIEAFSERIRQKIGKGLKNSKLIEYFRHIFENCKTPKGKLISTMTIYMIYGLPGEKPEDINELSDLFQEIDKYCKTKMTIFLTCNTFCPHPHTPLQYAPIDYLTDWNGEFKKRWKRLKNITIAHRGGFRSPGIQVLQTLTMRGGIGSDKLLYYFSTDPGAKKAIFDKENGLKKIRNILKSEDIHIDDLMGEINPSNTFPWDNIKTNYDKDQLTSIWNNYKNGPELNN